MRWGAMSSRGAAASQAPLAEGEKALRGGARAGAGDDARGGPRPLGEAKVTGERDAAPRHLEALGRRPQEGGSLPERLHLAPLQLCLSVRVMEEDDLAEVVAEAGPHQRPAPGE